MDDIKSTNLLWAKGGLFVLVGVISAAVLLMEAPTWSVGVLLAVTVWAFCRAYYFAFYVIEHYLDCEYRFSGLLSVVRYLLRKKGAG